LEAGDAKARGIAPRCGRTGAAFPTAYPSPDHVGCHFLRAQERILSAPHYCIARGVASSGLGLAGRRVERL
jgi:hypothetical protein